MPYKHVLTEDQRAKFAQHPALVEWERALIAAHPPVPPHRPGQIMFEETGVKIKIWSSDLRPNCQQTRYTAEVERVRDVMTSNDHLLTKWIEDYLAALQWLPGQEVGRERFQAIVDDRVLEITVWNRR